MIETWQHPDRGVFKVYECASDERNVRTHPYAVVDSTTWAVGGTLFCDLKAVEQHLIGLGAVKSEQLTLGI